MGNLAGDMVKDMSLRDAIGGMCTEPAHEWAKVTQKVTIKSGEGPPGEGELGGAVVGQEGVGVLEECDKNEPVIDPRQLLI